MRGGNGFVLVYSITDRKSFEELPSIHAHIFMQKDKDIKSGTIPMVLVGNKVDLERNREVTTSEGESLARSWGVPFFESSAKTRHNIEECFISIVKTIREKEKTEHKKKVGFSGKLGQKLRKGEKCALF